ncbi:cupredoxin domain-containing protein [Piscinibacter terrae]|uniref:Plastocyanin n=1 Tax=Piscinibacter terrae TaxID=2496871 RepID=A0A3N7HV24_9BURK|nr:plastocyanin [Albitalea terrae]RQP26208.1 plastocyanin [Albitalea terrae]
MSRHHLLRPSLLALLAAVAGVAGVANAGTLQISVTDKDGKPAQDVVVLVEPATKVAPKAPAAPVQVVQQDLKFSPFLTVVPVGTTLRFINKDSYDHHVRSTPSGPLGSMPSVKNFELRLDAAQEASASADEYKTAAPKGKKSGTSWQDVKVDQAGPIGLGCHLHSSMRGQVYVSGTPFFAKTDANGQASIDGVPDGAAEVAIWHPDQLAEQTPVRVTVTAAPVKAVGQLNFTPRKRKG